MALPVLNVQGIHIPILERHPVFRGTYPDRTNVATVQGTLTSTVWSNNWAPPPQGEAQVPFALQIVENQPDQQFHIQIDAQFIFPPNWINPNNGAGFFKIELKNGNNISLLSEVYPVTDPRRRDPNTFFVDGFKLQQFSNGPILGPFKSGINWKVSIISCNALGVGVPGQRVDSLVDIHLEAFFFIGRLHPVFWEGFPAGHRLEIIRSSVVDITTYMGINTVTAYKLAAARNIAQSIWTTLPPRLKYDNKEGKSRCNVHGMGGQLNLTTVLGNADSLVNCYDLAGISQAWCASLGPLFGRSQNVPDDQIKCNNPFWGLSGVPWYGDDDLMDCRRLPFSNHAWLEVCIQDGQPFQVLEACHARVNVSDLTDVKLCEADIDRKSWIAAAVNTGLYTAANIAQWKPIVVDRFGDAEETWPAGGITSHWHMPQGLRGLEGFIG
ncbi:hypothetical protein FPRO05_14257 [Fusarium proliferatum]|uniref:Uncharacterized protein n=1 Tax=Gibberella intermedia TaxID=948311 RepID=A0A365MTD7_GIBIN|nr:hypothetical protein FPRO05_14257 [Fusarium proliferatum]